VMPMLGDLATSLEHARTPLPLADLDAAMGEARLSPLVSARVNRLARQVKTLHDAVARIAPYALRRR
jgi:hypothetical protein